MRQEQRELQAGMRSGVGILLASVVTGARLPGFCRCLMKSASEQVFGGQRWEHYPITFCLPVVKGGPAGVHYPVLSDALAGAPSRSSGQPGAGSQGRSAV